MPKPKQFLKESKKKSKHAPQAPETADEYLAAGVDYEEAGEKWRGGDAAKSTRFFVRAIDCYDEALKKFPNSFDLAYNKARVQYELTQHPKLKDQLPGSLLDLLRTALDSSRYALALKEDNADVLFNTAQVLTSLAQALSDTPTGDIDPLPLLEEALELFQRCLTLQEYHHTENIAQQASADEATKMDEISESQDPPPPGQKGSEEPEQEERWATILEPITNSTLLDTLLAQLETLTTLTTLLPPTSPPRGLSWIEEYASSLLSKLPTYLESTATVSRAPEAGLTRADFLAAVADANFRAARIDARTYSRALDDAFGGLDIETSPEGLVNRAEALVAFNSSLRSSVPGSGSEDLGARWKALSSALECLTKASRLPDVDEVAKVHLLRGDVEMLRFRLGGEGYEVARGSRGVLLKNAETFYRGAGAVARSTGMGAEMREARVKELLAIGLRGEPAGLLEVVKEGKGGVRGVLEEAVEEGLVGVEELMEMGIS